MDDTPKRLMEKIPDHVRCSNCVWFDPIRLHPSETGKWEGHCHALPPAMHLGALHADWPNEKMSAVQQRVHGNMCCRYFQAEWGKGRPDE